MGNDNMFCSRNWDDDIERIPSPIEAFMDIGDVSVSHLPVNSLNQLIVDGMMVQSEGTDRILLSKKDSKVRAYQPHPHLWLGTIDEYIEYYFRLAARLEKVPDFDEWYLFTFPSTLESKFNNQTKERIAARKNLNITEIKKNLIPVVKYAEHRYKTRKLGAGAYLNYIFRVLSIRKDAKDVHTSLEYDGLKICLDAYGRESGLSPEQIDKIIPTFTIIDYFAHEMYTGISLSIEITAILLELEEKLQDHKLWEEAFSVFCEKALPRIVQSQYIFTRIAVARLFFLQVFWDEMVRTYRWHGHRFLESDFDKIRTFRKALSHCDILNIQPDNITCPDDEIKRSMNHIQDLLYEMKEPINLFQCINTPSRRIAIFCNPQHKYVPEFINELERLSSGNDISELPAKNMNMFRKVHTEVRKALKRDLP